MRVLVEYCICILCIIQLVILNIGVEGQRVIRVDQKGHGDFTTIQAAIDSVPSNNKKWVIILVKTGTYREKVKIPYDKPYVVMKGQGRKRTIVAWDDHQSIAQSPTFTSMADNIVVKSIHFMNSYNNPGGTNKNPRVPAVAALIAGDKSAFYRCKFSGVQDTLWDEQGRHYFYRCTIQGAVDFIFGSAQSIYESCVINTNGNALGPGVSGFITAQGRTNPNDQTGFVFKYCVITGTGNNFLGRPWRQYARVIFYKSDLTSVIDPRGWDAWHFAGHEGQVTFAENGCFGSGSDTSRRVRWEKKLNPQTVQQLTRISYIDKEGWLKRQPY